jgi:putative transposase
MSMHCGRRSALVDANVRKHGLVSRVRDWPYSSFHRYVREGLLADDWAGDVSGVEPNCGERIETRI